MLPGRGSRGLPRSFLVPEDHGELVAADAGDQVMLAGALLHHRSGLLEDLIADLMAKLVVVVLEIVDIEHQERDGEMHLPGAIKDPLQEMTEVSPVVDAGQVVGDRHVLHGGVARLKGERARDRASQALQDLPDRVGIDFIVRQRVKRAGRSL